MKQIAILAIARYGDMIQASPLLRQLKHTHPEAEITVVVEDRFCAILPLMQGIDRTIILSKRELAWEIATGDSPLTAYMQMDTFVRKLEERSYDLVVNITCSGLSAFLASAIKADEYSGFFSDDTGQRVIRNLWGQYVFSWFNDHIRKYNPINLVDIFTRLGGVMPDGKRVELVPTTKGEEEAFRIIQEKRLAGKRLVGLQLGASEENRCWPVDQFARLSDRLQKELGVTTILFGAPNEKELAGKALAAMEIPAVDVVGETGIESLFSLVSRCEALISNDTGTMHFAAAAEIPVVMLCIGPAFFRCTGPYGEGHLALQPNIPCSPCPYNLECGDPFCRAAITTDSVFNAARLLIDQGYEFSVSDFAGSKLFRSSFAIDGYLTWDDLCDADSESEKLTKRRENMWKRCFNDNDPGMAKPTDVVLGEFYELMHQGMKVTSQIMSTARIKPLQVSKLKDLGEKEAAVEAELKLMGYSHEILAPITSFLSLMRENIMAGEICDVAAETANIYRLGAALSANL